MFSAGGSEKRATLKAELLCLLHKRVAQTCLLAAALLRLRQAFMTPESTSKYNASAVVVVFTPSTDTLDSGNIKVQNCIQ